jgi:hypothetical protein
VTEQDLYLTSSSIRRQEGSGGTRRDGPTVEDGSVAKTVPHERWNGSAPGTNLFGALQKACHPMTGLDSICTHRKPSWEPP